MLLGGGLLVVRDESAEWKQVVMAVDVGDVGDDGEPLWFSRFTDPVAVASGVAHHEDHAAAIVEHLFAWSCPCGVGTLGGRDCVISDDGCLVRGACSSLPPPGGGG